MLGDWEGLGMCLQGLKLSSNCHWSSERRWQRSERRWEWICCSQRRLSGPSSTEGSWMTKSAQNQSSSYLFPGSVAWSLVENEHRMKMLWPKYQDSAKLFISIISPPPWVLNLEPMLLQTVTTPSWAHVTLFLDVLLLTTCNDLPSSWLTCR